MPVTVVFRPVIPRGSSSSTTSSLQNPCPSGTSIGYATFNESDIIFVVCNAILQSNATSGNDDEKALKLWLGLGLGLGIPALLTIIACVVLYHCGHQFLGVPWLDQVCFCLPCRRICRRTTNPQQQHQQPPQQYLQYLVEQQLAQSDLQDFVNGLLSDSLMRSLKHIRKTEGRELNEFKNYAIQLNHTHIADYIDTLTTILMNETV
jgi:hypothetical protein